MEQSPHSISSRAQFVELCNFFNVAEQKGFYGLSFSGQAHTTNRGWNLAAHYNEGGRSLFGEGFSIGIENKEQNVYFDLASAPWYAVADTKVEVSSLKDWQKRWLTYLVSAASFRKAALEEIRALQTSVRNAIAVGKVERCHYETAAPSRNLLPDEDDAVPSACVARSPLNAHEAGQALAQANGVFDQRARVIEENAEELYAAFRSVVPEPTCWSSP